MSAVATDAMGATGADLRHLERSESSERPEPGLVAQLAAFAGLSAFAAWRYATIEARPPLIRAFAIVGLADLLAAAVAAGRLRPGRRGVGHGWILRLGLIGLILVIALLIAGLDLKLLWPADWGRLAKAANKGLQTIATTNWPYTGAGAWARLDILLALALTTISAAAIAFWPASSGGRGAALRYEARRFTALALLIALYVIGVLDSYGGSPLLQGLLLLALLAGWLWLPAIRGRRRLSAAIGWLLLAGGLAALLSARIQDAQSWLDYRAWNLLGGAQPATAFAWDQTYGPISWPRSGRTMFSVRASTPGLWKVTTLDRFDGLRFVRSGTDPATEADLPLPLNDRWYEFATFSIRGLSSRLFPTEDGTTAALTFRGPVRYAADGTVSAASQGLRSGDSYSVMSYVPRPTTAELRAAPRTFPAEYLRYTAFDLPSHRQSGLRLISTDRARQGVFFTRQTVAAPAPGSSPAAARPTVSRILSSPYGPMYRLVLRVTAGSRSPYDAALAIESYLKANYAYGERPPLRRYPLEAFLFQDRSGYCQQFSGAMTLMLRMLGIPARVAVGFGTGSYDSATHSYEVSALDAHAWVEVYFTGIGWVSFDPTPPRTVASSQYFPKFTQNISSLQAIAATVGGPPQPAGASVGSVQQTVKRGGGGAGWLALGSAAALALMALAARWARGRARLARSLGGDGELAARELTTALPRLGYPLPATVTLAQIERLVRFHGGPEAARYVQLLRDRRYAGGPGAAITLRQRGRLRRGLSAHLGLVDRLRAHWALPPGTIAAGMRRS